MEKKKPSPDRTKATQTGSFPALTPMRLPETGGPKGSESTRYGDWERDGKCVDF